MLKEHEIIEIWLFKITDASDGSETHTGRFLSLMSLRYIVVVSECRNIMMGRAEPRASLLCVHVHTYM